MHRPIRSTTIFGLLSISLAAALPLRAAPADTTADAVTGQLNFTSNLANQGGATGLANSMNGNRNICIDPTNGRLWVADTSNNRVLGFDSPATFANGQNADIVLGQADFAGVLENKGNAQPSNTSMSGPRSVTVDPFGRLYVADSSNFRVLRFDAPQTTNQAAVQVFGQPNFTTATQNNGGTSTTSLGNPDGITSDPQGNVYVIDRNLHRVLIFNTPAGTDNVADVVLGQADFVTNTSNAPAGNPAQNNLAMPIAGFVDAAGRLYVCDEGNNRVLLYLPPFTNFMNATKVFGQPDFTSGTSNNGGRSASTLFGPVGAAVDPITGNLYVCDPINMRVLEFVDPVSGDIVADRVFGQLGDFTTGTVNKGGVSADSLNDTAGVAVDADGNLYLSDRLNSRLLRFDAPPPDMNTNDTSDDMDTNGTPDDMNTDGTMDDADTNGTPDDMDPGDGGVMMMPCGVCGAGLVTLSPLMIAALAIARRRMFPLRLAASRRSSRRFFE